MSRVVTAGRLVRAEHEFGEGDVLEAVVVLILRAQHVAAGQCLEHGRT